MYQNPQSNLPIVLTTRPCKFEWISVKIALWIHFMQLWMIRFIRSQGDRSAEGANEVRFIGMPLVETIFLSGFCKVRTIPGHILEGILPLIVMPSPEGHWEIDIARSTCVTQCAISKILRRARPNQRPLGHRENITTPLENQYMEVTPNDRINFPQPYGYATNMYHVHISWRVLL